MSEYEDYNDKIFQSSNNHSFHDSLNSQRQFIDFNNNFVFSSLKISNIQYQQKKFKQKQLPQTNLVNLQSDLVQPIDEFRRIRIIQTSYCKKKLYVESKKGHAQQTMDLNINFKTIFCRFIKELSLLKLLTKAQKQQFLLYKSSSPSFQSLNKFVHKKQNQKCKLHLINLLQSSQIVKCIICSNMERKNKLLILKFIQIMRKSIEGPDLIKKWKGNQ